MSTSYLPAVAVSNTTTSAVVSATGVSISNGARPVPTITIATQTFGECTWNGFSSTVTTYDATLFVNVQVNGPDPTAGLGTLTCTITANIAGTVTTLATITAPQSQMNVYMADVPSGTNLSDVSVTVTVTATPSLTEASSILATCNVYAILIG